MTNLKKICAIKTSYVSEEGKKGLAKYKYAGTDKSLLYNYCWSPTAEFLVKLLPTWVAYF